MTTPDRIEREITINAPVERVWPLVCEPGWWIGDGDDDGRRRYQEDGLEIVEHPKYGKFPLRVEGSVPNRYVSFRWMSGSTGEAPAAGGATLVEFWLSELTGGNTLVRVMESGFAALDVAEEERTRSFEGNTQGWKEQLDNLKRRAEHVSV